MASTSDDGPAGGPRTRRRLSRRGALQVVGLGSGVIAVAGTTGLTWAAIDGGVFATGTGPAYDAWTLAAPTGKPLSLVRAAILAANAHNTQPWVFTVADDRIEVYADMSRTIGAMDPLLREMHVSLGCALENLAVAGPPNGLAVDVTLLPDPADPAHVASVSLSPTGTEQSPLFDAIEARHTARGAYDPTRTVAPEQLDALSALVDVADTELVWLTTDAQMAAFSDLTIRATEAIIADQEQSADDFRWYRAGWDDIQEHRDGITIDPSGQSELIRAVSKLIPTTQRQNNDGWLAGTRDTQLPTAAAFGALVVSRADDHVQHLAVGRIWQRLHLTATRLGLGVQPLCQIPERVDREFSAGLEPSVTDELGALLPAESHAIMTFRIGHPVDDLLKSPRRRVEDVVSATRKSR